MTQNRTLIGEGNTAKIYDLGNGTILKLYRKGIPDSVCKNEFNKTKIAYQLVQIVPEPIEIIEEDGKLGAVYQKITGKTMLKFLLAKPWKYKFYAQKLSSYHIEIQKEVKDSLTTVKEKLKGDISTVNKLSDLEKEQIYEYLNRLPDGNTLCHFDFHPDNIMLDKEQHIVIDWMTACKGDKLSDIARTSVLLRFGKIPRVPKIVNTMVSAFQKKILKIYLQEYTKQTNTKLQDIEQWELPIIAARLCEWLPQDEEQESLSYIRTKLTSL